MRSLDLLIIYLALGAPFSVWLVLQDRAATAAKRSLIFLFGLLAWPITAGVMVYRLSPRTRGVLERSPELSRVRSELEQVGLLYINPEQAFKLRGAVEKYIGISIAAGQEGLAAGAEVFNRSKHPHPELATICLSRINRGKLKFHRESARNELITAVLRSSITADAEVKAVELLNKMASIVDDLEMPVGIAQMKSYLAEPTRVQLRTAA